MPGGRRGLVAPQNTFLENIIKRSNQQRKYYRVMQSDGNSGKIVTFQEAITY